MYAIREARFLAPDIKLFRVVAPRIARKQQAGQFVIVRLHDHGERIPLTIAGSNPNDGTIVLIVQGVGKTTKLMNLLKTEIACALQPDRAPPAPPIALHLFSRRDLKAPDVLQVHPVSCRQRKQAWLETVSCRGCRPQYPDAA